MISTYIDLLKGDAIEKGVALIIAACVALFLFIAGWLVFIAADSWFIDDKIGMAEVCGKNHTAEWYQTVYHTNGNGGGWVQTIYHPESWSVNLRMNRLSDSVSVSENIYDSVDIGNPVKIRYRQGRFSEGLYVTESWFTPPQSPP